MPGGRPAKWPWAQVKADFIAGRWATLEAAAKELQIPLQTIFKASARQNWKKIRDRIEAEAQEMAEKELTRRLARKRGVVLGEWLDMAEKLKSKALETLNKAKSELAATEAVKAIRAAVEIEEKALGLDRPQPGLNLHLHAGAAATAQLGLGPGDVALELSDEELAKIAAAGAKQTPRAGAVIDAPTAPAKPAKRRGRPPKRRG